MKMTLNEFALLQQKEQIEVLYQYGVYQGKRKLGGKAVVLYQLESFYVELVYRQYRVQVAGVWAFEDTKGIEPYLAQIDIEELINT